MDQRETTQNIRRIKIFPLFSVAVAVFVFTYIVFYAIDFLPEPKDAEQSAQSDVTLVTESDQDTEEETTATETPEATYADPYPTRIIIDSLDIDVSVSNPESRSIEDLDRALLDGAVRHPDSAHLRDEGHMFILGHSSYLPTVHNFNFRAFNGIQKLTWGDLIRVQSGDTEYVYRVVDNYEVKAGVGEIELNHSKPRLTLATCDSFGSVDDRFVVEAELIASEAI